MKKYIFYIFTIFKQDLGELQKAAHKTVEKFIVISRKFWL